MHEHFDTESARASGISEARMCFQSPSKKAGLNLT